MNRANSVIICVIVDAVLEILNVLFSPSIVSLITCVFKKQMTLIIVLCTPWQTSNHCVVDDEDLSKK